MRNVVRLLKTAFDVTSVVDEELSRLRPPVKERNVDRLAVVSDCPENLTLFGIVADHHPALANPLRVILKIGFDTAERMIAVNENKVRKRWREHLLRLNAWSDDLMTS